MRNIRAISEEELISFLTQSSEKQYRAKQIFDWLWRFRAVTFDQMKNIPEQLKNLLSSNFFFDAINISSMQESGDHTIKVAFKLIDNNFVEGVLIPSDDRVTACISSQAGCSLKCKFCATGTMGFTRNLTAGEIFDQVFLLSQLSFEKYNKKLSNIVFMGMGEPLLNYENVIKSISYITIQNGLGISNKKITISTSGIPDKIKQLADDNIKTNLALSLHSAIPEKRSNLLPVSNKYPLEQISKALTYYYNKSKLKITFEYLLLNGVNDSAEDAKALINFCSKIAGKVNVIEYNEVQNLPFKKSTESNTALFLNTIYNKKINVKLRKSRGIEIDAACGQLANKQKQN